MGVLLASAELTMPLTNSGIRSVAEASPVRRALRYASAARTRGFIELLRSPASLPSAGVHSHTQIHWRSIDFGAAGPAVRQPSTTSVSVVATIRHARGTQAKDR